MRQSDQTFDFIGLNRALIDEVIPVDRPRLIAFDPRFLSKAGKQTPEQAYFRNGSHGRAEKGLEVSAFSIVDLEHNTGYSLSLQQTPAPVEGRTEDETLIDAYLNHLHTVVPYLHPEESHLAVESQFPRKNGSMVSIETPTRPTSPPARGWSESYPICVGRSNATDKPVVPCVRR